MKSLLIGQGQEFSLVREAFLKTDHTVKIIGEKRNEPHPFRLYSGRMLTVNDLLGGKMLARGDLRRIESIFVSIWDRDSLKSVLKMLDSSGLEQPVFVISTAITEGLKGRFSRFNFVPIQSIFKRELKNMITKCEFLFKVNQLKGLLKPTDRVLITIFENPDPDSIASSYALKLLFSRIGVKSTIAYTGVVNRLQNGMMMSELGGNFLRMDDIDRGEFNKFALVDAQPYFFKDKHCFDIVIDHHPKRERFKASFTDIRRKIGATSTILTEYLFNAGVKINRKLATALLYGIKTDTNSLERNVTSEDLRSYRYLFNRADQALLMRIEHSEIPREALPNFAFALKNKRMIKDLLYANLGKVRIPEVGVMVADFLLRLDRISTVIVAYVFAHNLIIIFRNDGHKNDAGKLASMAFGKIGNAGGHKFMARAEIDCDSIRKVCRSYNKKRIDRFILGQIKKYLSKT